MQNSSMMATNNNPSNLIWNNINNLITTPSFISSSPYSFSSNITNNNNLLLAPPPNNHNIININTNMNMSTTTTTLTSSWLCDDDDNHVQEQPPPFHESLSQLLLSGIIMGEEAKKMEINWEEQIGIQQNNSLINHMNQENSVNSYNNNNININIKNNVYNNTHDDQEFHLVKPTNWSPHQINSIPTSSPQSCISTTFSDNLFPRHNNPLPRVSDQYSECNSISTSGALKKPKVQHSSNNNPSTFKVRKEKLGDRITALHQLVSPFGKTDTASVLLEAIGYIKFLHGQIEALSVPYLTSEAGDCDTRQSNIIGKEVERKCIFPEDPGQLLNENRLKRKGGPNQESCEEIKDLKSKGLCLVPISCTMNVGSDNGADYWAPAIGGGGF